MNQYLNLKKIYGLCKEEFKKMLAAEKKELIRDMKLHPKCSQIWKNLKDIQFLERKIK